MYDIERAINSLDVKTGAGPDNISPIIIKSCVESLVWPVWILFQKMEEMVEIPSKLKVSRVLPVYKRKGKKDEVKNYRITAISSVLMRVYENAIQSQLLNQVNPLLSNYQHGYRPRRSISTNLLNLSIMAHEAMANAQQLDVFYGDFENAFDKLWHWKIINELRAFKIGRKTSKWLYEFVSGRKFYVRIGKLESRRSQEVPAGSTLGPILFIIGTNDIVECVHHAAVLLFADDVKLAMRVSSIADTKLLQIDIESLQRWSDLNRLPLNLSKCETMTITRSSAPITFNYRMNGHIIERKDEMRDLGILIDSRFTFGAHIERIVTRARQSMGYIKAISKGQFDVRTLKVLYTSYVRSKLEFGSVVWDPHQAVYSRDIESVQKQFVLYVLGDSNRIPPYTLTPYEARCAKLELDTLAARRKQANLVMAFDLYNRRINDTTIEEKLVNRSEQRYATRSNRILKEMVYRNDYSYYQPIAKIVRAVNEYQELFSLSRSRFKTEARKKLIYGQHQCDSEL